MANSVRHRVMDAVLSTLQAITTANGYSTVVSHVSESMPQSIEQINFGDMPACYPIDTDSEHTRDEIGTGTEDCQADLTVMITCVVYDINDSTRTARTKMIRDVEKAMLNSTSIGAIAEWVLPGSLTTDKGAIPNYSIWDQEFHIIYRYNSADGG